MNLRFEHFEFKVNARIQIANRLFERGHQTGDGQRRLDQNLVIGAGFFLLRRREIHKWQKFLVHVLELIIPGHSNNLIKRPGLSWRFMYTEPLAKRVCAFKNLAHECLIHDGHLDRGRRVAVVEVASGKERRPDGLKITRAKIIDPRHTLIVIGTLGDDVVIPSVPTKRDEHRGGCGFHARDAADVLHDLTRVFCVALFREL